MLGHLVMPGSHTRHSCLYKYSSKRWGSLPKAAHCERSIHTPNSGSPTALLFSLCFALWMVSRADEMLVFLFLPELARELLPETLIYATKNPLFHPAHSEHCLLPRWLLIYQRSSWDSDIQTTWSTTFLAKTRWWEQSWYCWNANLFIFFQGGLLLQLPFRLLPGLVSHSVFYAPNSLLHHSEETFPTFTKMAFPSTWSTTLLLLLWSEF